MAQKLLNNEKYDESIKLLTGIIKSDPEFLNSYRKLAETWFLKNDLNGGIECFESLITQNPSNHLLTHGLGCLYYKFGKYTEAGTEYWKVLSATPAYASIYRDFTDNCKKLNLSDSVENILSGFASKDTNNAYIYYGLGYMYITRYKWEKAIDCLKKSLSLDEGILDAYYLLGAVCFNTSRNTEFFEISKKGLDKSKVHNDLQYQCDFLGNIGLALYSKREYKDAIWYIKKGIKLAGKTGKKREKIRDYGNLALSYRDLHDFEKALYYNEQALKGSQQLKDKNSEGLWYRNMGSIYQMMGEYTSAFENYSKALSIAEGLRDKYTKWLALYGIAFSKYNQGDYTSALEYYKKTLDLAVETGNKWAECRCYNGLGMINLAQGDYLKALDYNENGLALAKITDDKECESYCDGTIAIVYSKLGDRIKTFEYYNKALEICRKMGDKGEIARHLGNIGTVYHDAGEYKTAIKYYKESISLLKETDDKLQLARAYGNMGDLLIRMNDYNSAKEYLDLALRLGKELGAENITSIQLLNSGFLEYNQGHYNKAFNLFSKVLKYAASGKVPELFWQAECGKAMVLQKQNKPESALKHYSSAIDKIEEIQRLLPVEEFKSGFFDKHINVYQDAITLLSSLHKQYPQKNYDRLAFRFAEKAKARAFLENLIDSRTNVNNGIDKGLKQQEQQILRNIAEKQKQLYNIELSDKKRKDVLLQLKEYEDRLEKVSRDIKMKNVKYKNLFYPDSYDAAKIQRDILSKDEYILEFSFGDKQSHLWLISKDKFRFFDLPGKGIIEKAVEEYLNTIDQPVGLTNPFANHIKKGKEVFDLLLKKCLQEIDPGSHLVIVPDGILHYFPFESLVTDLNTNDKFPRYMIEDFTFSYSPSSTSMVFLSKKIISYDPREKYLLAFGDPDFTIAPDNAKFSENRGNFNKEEIRKGMESETDILSLYENEGFNFNPLPHSGSEVTEISGLFPKTKSITYLKSNANEETLKHENLEQYKYIHFATHGIIEEKLPLRSGIVLSINNNSDEDGILQVNEILNLRLNADMVVLSACQTAKGRLYNGEGIVGIARAFFYAGASSVVVCLWNINDRSSAILMKDFYSGIVNGKEKKDALQKAKLNMINSDYKLYRHPYYWAPYIIIGNFN